MTMADTLAVMNAGVIEQMGPPLELYERPRTTFVSNFLGQANLVAGRVVAQDDALIVLEVHGVRVRAIASRAPSGRKDLWVGVRPEKISLTASGAGRDDTFNALPGAVITDVSFTGVSTQYVVRMQWGQQLTVFEQNAGARPPLRPGEVVDLRWMPQHTFLLDASQDAAAGADPQGAG